MIKAENSPAPSSTLSAAEVATPTPPILIVDDKQENLISFRKTLTAAGFAVETAEDGMEALQYLLGNAASLVLLDVQMPGMNGFEVAQAIRQAQQHEDMPILFITATHRSEDFINYGYSVGAYDYLTKPVDSRLLVNKVTLFHTLYRQQRALAEANRDMAALNEELEVANGQLKQSTEALQQEKEYVEGVLGSMSEALLVVQSDGTIRDCNPALLRLTGAGRDNLIGVPVGTLFVEEEEEEEVLGRLLSLFQSRLQRIHDRDHDNFHRLLVEAPVPLIVANRERVDGVDAPVFLVSHEMERLLGYPEGGLQGRSLLSLLPSREQRQLQQRIEASGTNLSCVEEKQCYWLHAEGHELESQVCLLQIECGRRHHIIIQLQTEQTLSRELLAMTPFGKVFAEEEEEEEVAADRLLRRAEGEPIAVTISGSLLHNSRGAAEGVVLVLHDLRERKRAEQREQYAAFQSGVAEMSANILHNVGNTIQWVDLCVEELDKHWGNLRQIHDLYHKRNHQLEQAEEAEKTGTEDAPQVLEAAREAMITTGRRLPAALQGGVLEPSEESMKGLKTGVKHITGVIRAQQKGVKIDTHAVTFQLPALLDDLLLLSGSEVERRAITLQREIQPRMPEVRLPRNPLLQALINLVKNSAEAIEERIRAETLEAGAGEIRLSATLEAGVLKLTVEDNGNGFDPEQSDALMRFGYTTKLDGSGFGLHATATFVGSIGGKIRIESAGVGQGATVVMELPIELR